LLLAAAVNHRSVDVALFKLRFEGTVLLYFLELARELGFVSFRLLVSVRLREYFPPVPFVSDLLTFFVDLWLERTLFVESFLCFQNNLF